MASSEIFILQLKISASNKNFTKYAMQLQVYYLLGKILDEQTSYRSNINPGSNSQ